MLLSRIPGMEGHPRRVTNARKRYIVPYQLYGTVPVTNFLGDNVDRSYPDVKSFLKGCPGRVTRSNIHIVPARYGP